MFTFLFENLVLRKYKFWLLHFSTDSLPLKGTIHPPLSAKMQWLVAGVGFFCVPSFLQPQLCSQINKTVTIVRLSYFLWENKQPKAEVLWLSTVNSQTSNVFFVICHLFYPYENTGFGACWQRSFLKNYHHVVRISSYLGWHFKHPIPFSVTSRPHHFQKLIQRRWQTKGVFGSSSM